MVGYVSFRIFTNLLTRKGTMTGQVGTGHGGIPEGLVVLNEFASACLDSAQKELSTTGTVRAAVNFAYGLRNKTEESAISFYVLNRQGTADEEKEMEEITNYARKTSAEAVAVVMDLAGDPDALALFSGCDGILLVAASSSDGTAGIMRPYRNSPDRIIFGDPKVTDGFSMPILERIFRSSQ
jgi:hypothetical protein